MRLAAALMVLLACFAPAFAHEPRTGPNGGQLVDAGSAWHTELVTDGSTKVVLFLYDPNDKPVDAAGFTANAILLIDGKPHRFTLQPAEGPKLTGTAPLAVRGPVKGAVQLKAPDGSTAQAKF